jgi:hydrogenase nickel incorporation protein HypA/HybF
MHELSIAEAVVRAVAQAAGGRRVHVVTLQVGVLSGVVPAALGFAWDVATAGTELVGSRLEVHEAPVSVACRPCERRSALPEPLPVRCPVCGGREVDVVGGRELEIVSAEVDDPEDDEACSPAEPPRAVTG